MNSATSEGVGSSLVLRSPRKFSLDARTKFVMIILGNVLLFSYGDAIYTNICVAFTVFLIVLLGKPKAALTMIIFIAVMYIGSFLFSFAPEFIYTMWGLIVLPFYMFLPLFTLGYLLFSTTEISEIIASLQKMHAPNAIIVPLIVMFRFFPTLRSEFKSISNAMKLKGVKNNVLKKIEYIYVPILFMSVKISEDLNISGLTRGLGLYKSSTPTISVGFTFLDFVSVIVILLLILLSKGIISCPISF